MTDTTIYQDIETRTGGDIYIGVVGPVRTGKSTFINKCMRELVLPNITDKYNLSRTEDELPLVADGTMIMTTKPQFVPSEPIEVDVDNINFKVRMIDCVGYLVERGTRQYSNDTSTCQAGGTANWTCTCGASGTEEVPAHFGTSVLVRNEPETCTTNETNYYHCTSCGADWSAEEGEEMLGHVLNMINYSITPATCTEDGWEYNACTREGCDYEETNEIPALGHNMVFVETVDATCTEGGYDLYRCDREGCGEEEHRNETEAGHDYEMTPGDPSTCQTEGFEYFVCSICGDSYTVTLERIDCIDNGEGNCVICGQPIESGE